MRGIVKLFARTLSAAAVLGLVAGAPSPGLAARTCNGLLTIDYVAGPNFAKPGDALRFDVKVLAASTDSTPGLIEETTGYQTSQNDASCDNGLTSSGQQSSSIPLCNCPSTVCVDSVCNQDTGACSNTPKPNSTPCPDTDNDPCTTAGCDPNGQCDQRHMVCVTTTTTTPTTTTPPPNT